MLLTALSILLGVAFISGTLRADRHDLAHVSTASTADVYRNTAAVVRATEPFSPGLSYTG